MDKPPKTLGSALRRLFESITQRPMGWKMIDAFARLEEREEELRERDDKGRPASNRNKPDEPA
jgi:hypothetical protein